MIGLEKEAGAFIEAMQFMSRYAATLDGRNLDAWIDLFADQSSYTVGSVENHASGWPLLLINDDSKSKIEDRIRFIRNFWEGTFNDYLQRHVLSPPLMVRQRSDLVEIEQNFALYATETDFAGEFGGRSALVCVGRYIGEIVRQGADRKLSQLRVILDTCTLSQSLVYPV